MERLSEKEGSQFGMADSVEAKIVRDGKMLENEMVDEIVNNVSMADNVKVEINPQ
jgi:hypothetical protein